MLSGAGDGGGELSVEELFKRSAQEVHSLKERLAERQEYARRSRASEEVMRDQMQEAKTMVEEERVTKRELTYGLFIISVHINGQFELLHVQCMDRYGKTVQDNADSDGSEN